MNTEDLVITIKLEDEASAGLDEIKAKIEEIATVSKGADFQHLKSLTDGLKSISRSIGSINSKVDAFKQIAESSHHLANGLQNIGNNKGALTGLSRQIGSAQKAMQDLQDQESRTGKFNISSGGSAQSIITDFKRIGTAGMAIAKIPFKMLFSPMQGLAARASGLASSFGHLFHTIGRVALMRGIRGAIRMVTQALKEGVSAVYDWASAVGNSFVGTMNSISTSLTYFRNSVGAAISPILDAIAPVLDGIVDKCVTVINAFNQMIATLTGASTWRKAEKVATSFGGATNSAANGANNANKAAKELKRTLLGFDEINRLDDASGSGGNGGGGGGTGGGSAGGGQLVFSEQQIDSSIKNFADMLKEAWEKADFTNIGDLIGQKVGGFLLNVPWETKIQPGVAKIATSFGTLLNGMFDYSGASGEGGKMMWDGIAYTAYSALNTAMLGYVTFFNTVNWNGIGQGVGAALKKALLEGINWDLVAQALSAFPNAVIDAITGFNTQFATSDFKSVGTAVGNAVATAIINIKWKDFFNNAFLLARGLLNAINGALEGFGQNWAQIKDGIVNGIKSVKAEQWEKLGTDIGKLIFNVANFVANIVDALVKAIEAGHWGRLIGGIWKGIDDKVKAVYGGWAGAAKALGGWIMSHLGTLSLILGLVIGGTALKTTSSVLRHLVMNSIVGGSGGLSLMQWAKGLTCAASLLLSISMLKNTVDKNGVDSDEFKNQLGSGIAGAIAGLAFFGLSGTGLGFLIGVTLNLNVEKVLSNVANEVIKVKNDLLNKLPGWFKNLMGWDKDASKSKPSELWGQANGISAPNSTTKVIQNPIQKLKSGISTAFRNVLQSMSQLSLGGQQTTTSRRTFGDPNNITYGSDTVTKAQTFPVMPDTSNSDQWWKNVQAAWDGIVSAHKASRFHVAGVVNEAEEWWRQARTFWENKVSPGTTKAARFHVMGVVNEAITWWDQLQNFWTNGIANRKASRFQVTGVVNDSSTWWQQTDTFWTNATRNSKLYAKVGITDLWNSFADAWNTLQKYFNKNPLTATVVTQTSTSNPTHIATGGVYKNGSWHDITAYAGGGLPGTGQMFIAREAGPELVGTLAGSTAVMNNDQIVSSVSDGVARAVAAVLSGSQRDSVNDITIKVDSEVLYRAMKKGERKANGRYGTVVAVG